jgi:DNA polymerase IV
MTPNPTAPNSPGLCRDCLWRTDRLDTRRCPSCGSPRLLAHPELDSLGIAHLDCDAFYASVEKRDRPELADLPVIVGGGTRGVVTTCCYIARTYGVRSAMPMFKALQACPEAVVIRPDFSRYRAESRRIMAMVGELSPLVQTLSLDEAWIDLAGTERLNGGSAAFQMARLQRRILSETGLSVSVGLAPNKYLAKIASDLDKPRGFAVIGAAEARDFLAPRSVKLLPGVGPTLARTLERDGIRRIGDLSAVGARTLVQRYGAFGLRLSELAEGRDPRSVDPNEARKGISAETTFDTDIRDRVRLEDELWQMCEKAAGQARQRGIAGRVATLKLKTADFRIITRRRTLPAPIQTATLLFQTTCELLMREADGRAFRLIGAGLSDLVETTSEPTDLFAGDEQRARIKEAALDRIRARFGTAAVVSGRNLKPRS